MEKTKKLTIVSESVVDNTGRKIGDDPTKFPIITNRCKAIAMNWKTGQNYKVI